MDQLKVTVNWRCFNCWAKVMKNPARWREMMKVSMKTVQAHCAHIKEKLKLANRRELRARGAVRWQGKITPRTELSFARGWVFKLWTDGGCVEDQPQRALLFDGFRAIHALRLVLRTQPRSENGF